MSVRDKREANKRREAIQRGRIESGNPDFPYPDVWSALDSAVDAVVAIPYANQGVQVGITAQPGDSLILAIGDNRMTHQLAAEIRALVMARLPGLADVLLINATNLATFRPYKENQP